MPITPEQAVFNNPEDTRLLRDLCAKIDAHLLMNAKYGTVDIPVSESISGNKVLMQRLIETYEVGGWVVRQVSVEGLCKLKFSPAPKVEDVLEDTLNKGISMAQSAANNLLGKLKKWSSS